MRTKYLVLITVFIAMSSIVSADLMSIQGQVTNSTGNPVVSGDLRVYIYNASTGGTLIYDSGTDFNGDIINGRYDVLLGSGVTLTLTYGKKYYMDLSVNAEDLDFNGSERQIFESNVGDINNITNISTVGDNLTIDVCDGSSCGLVTIDNTNPFNEKLLALLNGGDVGSGLWVGETLTSTTASNIGSGNIKLFGSGPSFSPFIEFNHSSFRWRLGIGSNPFETFALGEYVDGTYEPRLTIKNGSGYVGINNANPQVELDVNGSANISTTLYVPQICLNGHCQNDWSNGTSDGTGGWDNSSGVVTTNYNVSLNGSLFVDTTNNFVGINTTNPTQTLDVNGTVSISGVLILSPTDSPGTCNAGSKGAMYMDDSLSKPCFCNGGNWTAFDNVSEIC